MNQFPVLINSSPADACPVSYARVSLPLSRGEYFEAPSISIKNKSGENTFAQSEVLAHWPDGSIRVVHATFPARGGDCVAEVSAWSTPERISPMEVKREGDVITIINGDLRAVIGGANLVSSISLGEREFFGENGIEVLITDGNARVFRAGACRDVHSEIETQGPHRVVVCSKGKCCDGDQSFLDFRLRFEFLAGVEGFSLSYSFSNLERGQDFQDVRAIELKFDLKDADAPIYALCQQNHGLFGAPHVAFSRETINVCVDNSQVRAHVKELSELNDQTRYPFYLQEVRDVENWAAISNGDRTMFLEMDDFHLLRPKSLHLENSAATFGIWPRESGVLQLQQGRSREVTIRVALRADDSKGGSTPVTRDEAHARIAQLRDVWRAQLAPEIYASAKFFDQSRVLPFDPQTHPRFEGWLDRIASNLHSVATFFDLGDTTDSGYRSTYTPLGRQKRMRGEDGGMRWFSTGYGNPALAMNDMDDFEPVWVNNEYDVIFALGTEFLRTGDLTLFQKLKWFSRHTIEVDFLDYSDHKWLHRAQPAHSARHTTTGAYPSHFWTQGLAQYYFLTGDKDALEVIIALAEKTIENLEDRVLGAMNSGLNREVGWGVLSLVCAFEASGEKRFDDYARKILDDIMAEGLPTDLPNFSFGHTSMLIAARQYLQVHKDEESDNGEYNEKLNTWFLSWVDLAIDCLKSAPLLNGIEGKVVKSGAYDYTVRAGARGPMWARGSRRGTFDVYGLALDSLAYAHEISGDEKYLHAGFRTLETLLESPTFSLPAHEGKPFAMQYRTWINFLAATAGRDLLSQWEYKYSP